MPNLVAPFPYFGGKRRIAHKVWEAIGTVHNYVEPFCGSAAVLLARPGEGPWIETVNDSNGFICNFWRSIAFGYEKVIPWVTYPTCEQDLHARHKWLQERRDEIQKNLSEDPLWYDPQVAGWWAWGASMWFGGGWCTGPLFKIKPRSSGHTYVAGTQNPNFDAERDLGLLSERTKLVRALCGDWKRVVTPAVLFGDDSDRLTGVFLDPPYGGDCDARCYGTEDSQTVAQEVSQWCLDNGANKRLRIVLAGYEGDHPALEENGWAVYAWSGGGYRRSDRAKENAGRERIWTSPHCTDPNVSSVMDLFG